MRVLITGSRTWPDRKPIWDALDEIAMVRTPTTLTVVHGACPSGADWWASQWCRDLELYYRGAGIPIVEEPHPADWNTLGRRAGYIRNAAMVALGADVCLAFASPCTARSCRRPYPHDSHGTTHCAELAQKAGIDTRTIRPAEVA